MTHNFPRHSKITPHVAIGGTGCYITDSTGKKYFDGSGGAAVSCLGHGDPDIAAAMKDQIDKLSFAHTSFFTSPPAEALADLLIANAPSGIDRVYFVSGGSEAIEASLSWRGNILLKPVRRKEPISSPASKAITAIHLEHLLLVAMHGDANNLPHFYSLPAILNLVIAIAEKPMVKVITPMGNVWPMRWRPKFCGLVLIRSWLF